MGRFGSKNCSSNSLPSADSSIYNDVNNVENEVVYTIVKFISHHF